MRSPVTIKYKVLNFVERVAVWLEPKTIGFAVEVNNQYNPMSILEDYFLIVNTKRATCACQ